MELVRGPLWCFWMTPDEGCCIDEGCCGMWSWPHMNRLVWSSLHSYASSVWAGEMKNEKSQCSDVQLRCDLDSGHTERSIWKLRTWGHLTGCTSEDCIYYPRTSSWNLRTLSPLLWTHRFQYRLSSQEVREQLSEVAVSPGEPTETCRLWLKASVLGCY